MNATEGARQILDRLVAPIEELRFLLDRGYRRVHAIRVVGEHHQLTQTSRKVLERVVFPAAEARARSRRLVGPKELEGQPVVVDGYNQLIGLRCLLDGAPLFLADDGLVRDEAAVRERSEPEAKAGQALELLCTLFADLRVESVGFIFDRQVSRSGELAASCRRTLKQVGLPGEAVTEGHADRALREAAAIAIVSTSDRVIVDGAHRVFDAVHTLARLRGVRLGRLPPPLVVTRRPIS